MYACACNCANALEYGLVEYWGYVERHRLGIYGAGGENKYEHVYPHVRIAAIINHINPPLTSCIASFQRSANALTRIGSLAIAQ